jgi:MFS family permease
VALAALLLTGGTLADVAGRRRVFVGGLAVFAAASAACALADSATALIAARAVQGAGAALVLPGGLAVLAAAYPEPGPRARAVGLWAATSAAALVLGPVVGGVLVAASGWPAVFWVNVPLCVVVAVVVLLVAPSSAVASPQPAGALLVTGPLRRGHRVPASRRLSRRDGQTPRHWPPATGDRDTPRAPSRHRAVAHGRPCLRAVAPDGTARRPATRPPPTARAPPQGLDLPGSAGCHRVAPATYAVVLAGRDGLGPPVARRQPSRLLAAIAFAWSSGGPRTRSCPWSCSARDPSWAPRWAPSPPAWPSSSCSSSCRCSCSWCSSGGAAGRAPAAPAHAGAGGDRSAGRPLGAARGPRAPVVAGLLLTAAGLALTGWRLDRAMSDVELAGLLVLCGLGIGLTTAPVVTASLDAVARSRSGLAAATVNVARELGGVVAVAGLGAVVVARLSRDLTGQLLDLGVPAGRTEVLVEALLRGATNNEVIRLAEGQVALDVLLRLRPLAEVSYVGSVRLALVGAALVALVCAGLAGRWLQPRVDQLDHA